MNRFRFLAKSFVHGANDWSGRPRRQRQRLRGKLIILTYHSFCENWPSGLFSSLPVRRFEKQIKFLRNHFKLVSLHEGLDHLEQGDTGDKPWLAITVDDGFGDNYTHAWPLLQKYGVPATVFLATDFVDTGRPPWPTQLVEILERTQLELMEAPFRADIRRPAEKSAVAQQLKKTWKTLPPAERFRNLADLREHLRVSEESHYPPLTWSQILEMQAGGVDFGSHTVYHSILSAVEQGVVMQELMDSKRRLEDKLQKPCTLFAYPDGKHNLLSKNALDACGYQVAVTQDAGFNDDHNTSLELNRVEIPFIDPMPSFRSRVSLALQRGVADL